MRQGSNGLVRLAVEPLEDRCNPNTYPVSNFISWDETVVGSLPWAVDQANKNADVDLIYFDTGLGVAKTITAQSTVDVIQPVIIQGPNLVGSSITLKGIKPFIFNGLPAAPPPGNPGDPPPPPTVLQHQILGVRFEDCTIGGIASLGGAFEVESRNVVTVRNCAFIDCIAGTANNAGNGGAVYVRPGAKLVVDGDANQQPVDNGTFSGAQTVFSGNKAVDGNGGAIASDGIVELQTAWFQNNKAGRSGGAISVFGVDSGILMNAGTSTAMFKGNKALKGNGGGINFDSTYTGTSSLTGVSFVQNDAQANLAAVPGPGISETGVGGGIYAGGGSVKITGGSFANNTSGTFDPATGLVRGGAAAMCVINSHVTLTGVNFDTNNATATGQSVSGVFVAPTGWLTIGVDKNTFNETPLTNIGGTVD